jgi:hypothetical protein
MISRPIQLVIAALLLVAGWLALDWYMSDEQRIHRRLQRMQSLVAKSPAESDLAGLGTARKISAMFADPFVVRTDPEGYSATDRRTLISGIHQYRSRSGTLVMEISGEEIYLDRETHGANSFFSARFITDISDLRTAETYDVRIHWVDADGEWMIDNIQVSANQP